MATPARLGEVLGETPVPWGSWEREAIYASRAAPRRGGQAPDLAARLRCIPGVRDVAAGPGGLLLISVAVPGEIVREIVENGDTVQAGRSDDRQRPQPEVSPMWPDFPRTWTNPGFVVRYAYTRAVAVQRWARDLGFTGRGAFHPETLVTRYDRAVIRVLAEWPSRTRRPARGRPAYLERLATAYHDAHEHAPAIPAGDGDFTELHTARLWMAKAVRTVLAQGLRALGEQPPTRI